MSTSTRSDTGFQYTIWMELERIESAKTKVHMLRKGHEDSGSLCGKLGPQDPYNPSEFYTIHPDSDCAGCMAMWAKSAEVSEEIPANDLTSVKQSVILSS